jgi:hypothetical protein
VRLLGNRPTASRESSPVDVVDDALRLATGREPFTADEALRVLRQVQAGVPEGECSVPIAGIVADAAASFSDEAILDRDRLVNPLLDIRLVLGD